MGVLNGIKVLDFGQFVAGPLTGMLLADQGADVVKVDPPGGPSWDTPANAIWNRGKRSIALDLKDTADLERAQALIASADVLLENFRPGVMDRLGLGAKAATTANPRLVYCSIPGFASDDPRSGIPAWEGVVAAAATTYHGPGPILAENERMPVYTAIPIASSYAAFQSAVSIAIALLVRERDGVGQRIEVPMFDGMFAAIGGQRIHNPHTPLPAIGGTWLGQFECKDGRWVMFGGSGNTNFREFVEAADITSWDKEGLTDRERLAHDPELAAEQGRRIVELFKTRTARQWEDDIATAGSECAVCRTSAEWLDHSHARESKMVIEVHDPKLGKMLQPGINPRLSGTPGAVRSPAPALDQHRTEVLSETKASSPLPPVEEVEATLRSALDGVRVLDLCIILAGPTCGRTLAEFGADVVKIDDPNRSPIVRHNTVNRGKRSILLDLKKKEGRDLFWRLLEGADVVVQNNRKGRVDDLGLGYEEVRKRKPDIIYASMNAYGHLGPWGERPGHEQFAQATTGMQRRFGGDGQPQAQPHPINDYGTGLLGAYGVALALLHRKRTGEGQHVDGALAYTAMTLQSAIVQDYEGKVWDEPRGQDTLGSGPLHRAYKAADGWLFIGARKSDLVKLSGVAGLEGAEELKGENLERILEQWFLKDAVDLWVGRLNAAGIGAHRVVMGWRDVMDDPWVQSHGLSITRDHEGWGPITTTGPAPRMSRTPVQPGRVAPKPGSDAHEILAGMGMADKLDGLVETGVVRLDGIMAGGD